MNFLFVKDYLKQCVYNLLLIISLAVLGKTNQNLHSTPYLEFQKLNAQTYNNI